MSGVLADLADDESQCTTCAAETIAKVVSSLTTEMKLAKKNKDFSKEDKKALKKETKLLFKGVKDGKGEWTEKQ